MRSQAFSGNDRRMMISPQLIAGWAAVLLANSAGRWATKVAAREGSRSSECRGNKGMALWIRHQFECSPAPRKS